MSREKEFGSTLRMEQEIKSFEEKYKHLLGEGNKSTNRTE